MRYDGKKKKITVKFNLNTEALPKNEEVIDATELQKGMLVRITLVNPVISEKIVYSGTVVSIDSKGIVLSTATPNGESIKEITMEELAKYKTAEVAKYTDAADLYLDAEYMNKTKLLYNIQIAILDAIDLFEEKGTKSVVPKVNDITMFHTKETYFEVILYAQLGELTDKEDVNKPTIVDIDRAIDNLLSNYETSSLIVADSLEITEEAAND